MSVEKKTIRSDIPGSHVFLNGNIGYVGSTADEARRLVVARDISLQGEIGTCNYLVIEGVVQATSFAARRMDILESGLFCGNAELQDCVIAGRFEGNLSVFGRLTVKSTGQIQGEIRCGILEVEAGARINGQVFSIAPQVIDAAGVPSDSIENFPLREREPEAVAERATAYRRVARA